MSEEVADVKGHEDLLQRAEHRDCKSTAIPFTSLVRAVALTFRLARWELIAPRNVKGKYPRPLARQALMLLAVEHTAMSVSWIGRHMNRDHTTVLHGVKSARTRIAAKPDYAALVAKARQLAGGDEPLRLPTALRPGTEVAHEVRTLSRRQMRETDESKRREQIEKLRKRGWSAAGIARYVGTDAGEVKAVIHDIDSKRRKTG